MIIEQPDLSSVRRIAGIVAAAFGGLLRAPIHTLAPGVNDGVRIGIP